MMVESMFALVKNGKLHVCEKGYQWCAYQANIACRLLGYNNNGTFLSIMYALLILCVPQGQVWNDHALSQPV